MAASDDLKTSPAADMSDLTRREALKLAATVAVAASAACSEPAQPPAAAPVAPASAARTFFTAEELALADELSEIIIPTDEHSPGAKAAKVADYIDARLAEAWDEADRTLWRQGLKLVDGLSQSMHKKPFMQASPAERLAVVTRMAANEDKPDKPEEKFFADIKERVVNAYYTSEIGIKQEMQYLGNTYLKDFVGTDVSGA
jgi:hypothetical protein